MFGIARDADADGCAYEFARDIDGGGFDALSHAQRHLFCAARTRFGQQHQKLIAAVTRQYVALPDMSSNALDEHFQQAIAGLVAESVVHRFEAVRIDHYDGVGVLVTQRLPGYGQSEGSESAHVEYACELIGLG
jgi:hypothetical protein